MNEPLIRRINREQMLWRAVDVERLIGEDHPARAIWELVGRLDLTGFYEGIECSAEEGGRPAFDPRLLISVWIYAYSQGIGSAREVAAGWPTLSPHTNPGALPFSRSLQRAGLSADIAATDHRIHAKPLTTTRC
jgi:hypothetical protein